MSSASFPSLELQCRPSAWLRAAVVALALLAAVSVMLSGLAAWWLAVVPVLGALAWRGTDAHAGLVLRFGGDGTLRAERGGSEYVGELRDVAERGPLLVVAVRLVPREGSFAATTGGAGATRTLRICFGPDTASSMERRSLRLWCARHTGTDDGLLATMGLH